MATKHFCDRCGKEINQSTFLWLSGAHGYDIWSRKYELCDECYKEMKEWFESEPNRGDKK